MSLKRKVEQLEKLLGIEGDLEGARGFVMFGLRFGILPETIDFEKLVKACASEGISLGKIIDEIHKESIGLPKLPYLESEL